VLRFRTAWCHLSCARPLADEPEGDVILFVKDGRLSYLEYVYYTDRAPTA
jgi:hypothetical protein